MRKGSSAPASDDGTPYPEIIDEESAPLLKKDDDHSPAIKPGQKEHKESSLSKSHSPPENGKSATVFLLLNTMIGSGILNQPQVFSQAGIVGTLLLYVIGACSVFLGLQLLIECGVKHKKLGFTELANHAFGRKGDLIADLAVVLSNFGGLLSYLTVVGGQLSYMIKESTARPDDQSWYFEEYTILPMVALAIILPLCLTRHYGHFVFISYVSICSITAVMLCVLIAGPIKGAQFQHSPLLWISLTGMMRKFGSVIFALACAYAAFHAFESMSPPLQTTGDWMQVTSLAVVIGGSMCLVTGIAGYTSFRESTAGDILDNFDGPYFYFFKILLVMHLILYIPLDFVVLRHSFCKLFNMDAVEMSTLPYTALTVVLLAFTVYATLLSYYMGLSEGDAFGYILDITGGVCGSLLGFVLPGAIYLKLNSKAKDEVPPSNYSWLAKGLLAWGIFVMIMVPIANFS